MCSPGFPFDRLNSKPQQIPAAPVEYFKNLLHLLFQNLVSRTRPPAAGIGARVSHAKPLFYLGPLSGAPKLAAVSLGAFPSGALCCCATSRCQSAYLGLTSSRPGGVQSLTQYLATLTCPAGRQAWPCPPTRQRADRRRRGSPAAPKRA